MFCYQIFFRKSFQYICTTISNKREGHVLYSVKGQGLPGLCYVVHVLCHKHYVPTCPREYICDWTWPSYWRKFIPGTYSCYTSIGKEPWLCTATEIKLPPSSESRVILTPANTAKQAWAMCKLKWQGESLVVSWAHVNSTNKEIIENTRAVDFYPFLFTPFSLFSK